MAENQEPHNKTAPAPRSRRHRRFPVVALLTGTAAVVITAAVAVAGSALPAQPAARSAVLQPVALPAGQSVSSCPGPARLLEGADAGTDTQFSPVSRTSSATVSSLLLSGPDGVLPGATLSPVGDGAPLATLAKAPASNAGSSSPSAGSSSPSAGGANAGNSPTGATKAVVSPAQKVDAASVLRSDPVNGKTSLLNAVMAFSAKDGDLQGLAAVNCQTPANEAWLTGASTTVGRTGVLMLSNTSQTPATVNLDLYGDKGPLQAPGGKGLLVPPGSTRSVVLAGLGANQEHLTVHLKSIGGPVAAVIQQTVLRGLVPGGVELIEPAAAPALRQVIPGVQAQEPAVAAELSGQKGYGDAASALDVTVPGGSDTVVQVKVYGTGGQASLPNGGVFTAKAGSVTELPLTGLPAGAYTVDVRSEASFTANVRVVTGTKAGAPVDFGSAPASAQLGDGQLMVMPPAANSKLLLGVPDGHAKVSLTPVANDGSLLAAKTVEIGAGTTVAVDPQQLTGTSVAGFILSATGDPAYGAQMLTAKDGTGISVASIPRPAAGSQAVKVVLGY